VSLASLAADGGMTNQRFARLPGRGDAGRTELAERLLAGQEKFAGDVPRATTPITSAPDRLAGLVGLLHRRQRSRKSAACCAGRHRHHQRE